MSGLAPTPAPASLLGTASVILPNRLFFLSLRGHPRSDERNYFYTADHDLQYEPFEADFGPLKLSQLIRFCRSTANLLTAPHLQHHKLYFYSSHDGHKRANAAYLITAYLVLCQDYTTQQALSVLAHSYPPFLPYRDVSCGVSLFNCTLQHCLSGLWKAKQLGWVDWRRFDCEEYEKFEDPHNGDWNWMIPPSVDGTPGKLIAFCTPIGEKPDEKKKTEKRGVGGAIGGAAGLYDSTEIDNMENIEEFRYWKPEEYAKVFRPRGVTGVVRLCKKLYNKRRFTELGIKHLDLIYPDGGTPSDAIVNKFLAFVESNPGGVAVHCKAGLGRTGSLIGCYLMKHHGFSAEAAIAWMRICRPGSVIGPQQQFLVQVESRLKRSAADAKPHVAPLVTSKRTKKAKADETDPSLLGVDSNTLTLIQRSRKMQSDIDTILGNSRTASFAATPPPQQTWEAATPTEEDAPTSSPYNIDPNISVQSLKNLRALTVPPTVVVKTVLCAMRLMGYHDATWTLARDKLGTTEMGKRIQGMREDIEADRGEGAGMHLRMLEGYVNDPSCSAERVSAVCQDAKGLSLWLHAVARFCRSSLNSVCLPNLAATPSVPSMPPSRTTTPGTSGKHKPNSKYTRPAVSMIFSDFYNPVLVQ